MKNLYQTQIKLIAALIFLNIGIVAAQGPLQWTQSFSRPGSFGGGNPDVINDIAALSTGSTISIGETSNNIGDIITDIGVVKYSPSGQLLNTFYLDFYNQNLNDKPVKVIVREPYVYILASVQITTASFGVEGDIGIVKLDTNLNFISQSYLPSPFGIDEVAIDMGMDAANNIYIVGSSNRGGTTGTDIVLLKFDQDLVQLFEKYNTSTGVFTDIPSAIKVQPNGVCNIVGTKNSATKGSQIAVMKYWGNGILLWQKTYDVASTTTNLDLGKAVSYDLVTDDVYVVGSGQLTAGDNDWVVLKYQGTTGALSWAKRFAGVSSNNDEAIDVAYANVDGLYVFGNIRTTVSGVTSNNFQLRKLLPSNGSFVWTKTYDGPFNTNYDKGFSMLVTPNEYIYTFGRTESTSGSTTTYGVIQCFNKNGLAQWTDLLSSNSVSIFQQMDAIKGAYNLSTQSLHVASRMLAGIGIFRSWITTKYGPTSLFQNPSEMLAERIDLNSKKFGINIFPNPFIENFTITNETNSSAIFEIYNLEGKLILRKENSFLQNDISTEGWANGTYIVKIIGQSRTITQRVVKY